MRYAVLWNAKSLTMTLSKEDATSVHSATATDKSIGTVVYAEFGELPPPGPYPEVNAHLENIARCLAVDPREVSVKNDTGNERLDQFEKEGLKDVEDSKTDKFAMDAALATLQAGPDVRVDGALGDGLDTEVNAKAADKEQARLAAQNKPTATAEPKKAPVPA